MIRIVWFVFLIGGFMANMNSLNETGASTLVFDYYEAESGQRFYPDSGEGVLISAQGYGFPKIEYRTQRGVNSDRARATGKVVQPRILTWVHRADYESNRKEAEEGFRMSELLRPDRLTLGSRVQEGKIVRRHGDGRETYIKVLLQDGPIFNYSNEDDEGNVGVVSGTLEFVANDPFFYDRYTNFLPLVVRSNPVSTLGNIFYQPSCQISAMAGGFGYITGTGTAFIYQVLETNEGEIYAAGAFSEASNNGADDPIQAVARWNPDTNLWEPLGSGVTGSTADFITAMVYRGDGKLFVAGDFDSIDGVTAYGVAVYDIQTDTWSNVGGVGTTVGLVQDLIVGPSGEVYAGGSFSQIVGTSADKVAVWDGVSWTDIGSFTPHGAPPAIVFTLELDDSGNLYAGGFFASASGQLGTQNLAVLPSGASTWERVGGGADNTVNDLHWYQGYLYVGGVFDQVFQTPVITPGYALTANRIARWNGSSFLAMAGGTVSGSVQAITNDNEGRIWVGGFFSELGGGVVSDKIAIWTPDAWSPAPYLFDPPAIGSASVNAIAFTRSGVPIIGGRFSGIYGAGCADVESTSSAQSYAKIEITGPGQLIEVKNYTQGTSIRFDDLVLPISAIGTPRSLSI